MVIYEHQRLYIRPKGRRDEVLVAELEGTRGRARDGPTSVHSHVRVVEPDRLNRLESDLDKYARWELKVKRTGW